MRLKCGYFPYTVEPVTRHLQDNDFRYKSIKTISIYYITTNGPNPHPRPGMAQSLFPLTL
ncbi:hypothetical protein SAMN04488505_10815 [Chitinophaga rupis]|uniref:Uncharacterized protein n=1 Tax=Chitinophaga rupis TaxID=573321 RepID=A0A1H8DJ94_9BACT|nr:hypothetical protein [Chitinophaga rupis]SEN07236.1 hypothetical protein SAMN04488505_10815 [Chitinophaga rupis]